VSDAPEIDDLLTTAISALSTAQVLLRKGAKPSDIDVLRKGALWEPRAEPMTKAAVERALDTLADLNRRLDSLEARDLDAQHTRKTAPREATR
jgi:hypothetical protein